MSRTGKPNVKAKDNSSSVDGSLFQLPTVPPWRTPKVKSSQNPYSRYNSVTPLRRPSTLLIHHLEQPAFSSAGAAVDQTEQQETVGQLSLKDDAEYDFSPFSEKSLLRESKIEAFLQAERAAHCLIFHKGGHCNSDADKYRPDFDCDCEDTDGEETKIHEYRYKDNGPLLLTVPGCSKHDLNQLLNKNHMRQRPNVRRIDEILNHEFNALKSFWGESELPTSLERNHLHEQYLLLQQEQKEIARYRTILRTQKVHSLGGAMPDSQN
ncbi:uncharacterized protein ZBAI_06888 [Zygosaccharomyces bailii ISA1307]|nr:uncharacterized protein ZBAI_06888 [Zygosaccharomyces bailii ISA1307]